MSKPVAEINRLRRIAQERRDTVYSDIIEEVLGYVFQVREWTKVATSGSATPYWGPFGAEYDVRYQEGNLANIVHELTHIACYVGYDNDFLCWPPTGRVKPARTYSAGADIGFVTNQEQLQFPEMDQLEPLLNMGQRIKACVPTSPLTADQQRQVMDKMQYGTGMFGGVEFDPCVNNVLGWLIEWGYPRKGSWFSRANNQLFTVTEQVARAQYEKRIVNRPKF